MWLGPAPNAYYCGARLPVNCRWIHDYYGGNVTDIGAHNIDIAQWGLSTESTGPIEILNAKATFPPKGELWNMATSYYFEAIFKSGVKMIVADSNQVRPGITFEGERGKSIWCDSGQFESNPTDLRRETRSTFIKVHITFGTSSTASILVTPQRRQSKRPTGQSRSRIWETSPSDCNGTSCAGILTTRRSLAMMKQLRC